MAAMKIWMSRRTSELSIAIACFRRFSAIGPCQRTKTHSASSCLVSIVVEHEEPNGR
jgi:hypothetical protein